MHFAPRDIALQVPPGSTIRLVLGDSSELRQLEVDCNLAAGVPITCDASSESVVLYTSIVGLPPVYVHRDPELVAVCSDLQLLIGLEGKTLRLNPVSIRELGSIGHPVEHRTLFANTELVTSGGRLTINRDAAVEFQRTWSLPRRSPTSWPEFIEAQITAFTDSVSATDTSSSFLSLTAGLDTRTVFAALASQDRLVPAVTMTGPRLSLDARTAGRLCRSYGVAHTLVVFDDSFVARLPSLMESACRLSGGLASLDQAPEVYLYEQLGGRFRARMSGNLGNQVGRGGTEGVSTRGASLAILAEPVRVAGHVGTGDGHWLLAHFGQDEHATLEYILGQEMAFTLASNFPIGSHFAIQQTPYASRALIETLAWRPSSGVSAPSASVLRMRLRDLRHRFLGVEAEHSFQRTLVKRLGGSAARYPINWGWRAAGGISPSGAVVGLATLVGMYARARGIDDGPLARPLALAGLPALHDFRESRRWLRYALRDYARDVLGSQDVQDLFDARVLGRVLDEHFGGSSNHYDTVTYALDVALAHRSFCAMPAA